MANGVIEDLFNKGFRGGDLEAQGEFVAQVTPFLIGYLQRRLRVRGPDVEMIAAEIIEETIAETRDIKAWTSLLPYMYRKARWDNINRWRRSMVRGGRARAQAGKGAIPLEPHELVASTAEPWERIHAAEVLAELLACVRTRLDGALLRTFEALVLHYWDNRLTAKALQITRNAVAVSKSRIRDEARPCFDSYEGKV